MLTAWALLLAAWVMGNVPFAAPDEVDHYIRAVGIGEGSLIGTANRGAQVGATSMQISWTAQAVRDVSLPTSLDPRPFLCKPAGERHTACPSDANPHSPPGTLQTAVGNYQPLPYLLPAALLRAGSSAPAALRLGRVAEALTALAMFAIAVFALHDIDSPLVSLLGLLLAVTPMVLFCAASLGGSATEIAGAIAFFSCLLRICRPGLTQLRWWVFAALSGSTLVLSRAASPVWLALASLVALGWSSRPRTSARRSSGDRMLRVGAASVAVFAMVLNRAWEGVYGSHVSVDNVKLHAGFVAGTREWWRAFPELVGKFGHLDVKLPLAVPLMWFALVLALSAAAWAVSERRERVVLALVFAGGLFGPIAFYALLIRPTGFGLQGRHVLPFLVVVPLLAGEALYRGRDRVRFGRLRLIAAVVPSGVAVMQATAWYINARHYAVGDSGPTWFPGRAAWAPPTGWWTWLAAALLAGLLLNALVLVLPGRSASVEA